MFIFSKDGEKIINSNNVRRFCVTEDSPYEIMADEYSVEFYSIKDDAVKELHEIIRQIEAGMTSYQLR